MTGKTVLTHVIPEYFTDEFIYKALCKCLVYFTYVSEIHVVAKVDRSSLLILLLSIV